MQKIPERKRIAVVTIGGTPFMTGKTRKPGEVTLPPLRIPGEKEREQARNEGRVFLPIDPNNVIIEHHPVLNIDSSEIRVHDLNKLGEKLSGLSNDSRFDGIVVISGTDTMHDIVVRMAHHLHNLKKPTIFTGAQVELAKQGSDFRRNYESAVRAAWDLSTGQLNSVLLCFGMKKRVEGSEIYHPLNTFKRDPTALDAFNHSDKRVVGKSFWDSPVKTTQLGKQLLPRRKLIAKVRAMQRKMHVTPSSPEASVTIGEPRLDLVRGKTTFSPVKENLINEVKLSESDSIDRINVDKDAQVVIFQGSGQGNVFREALRKVAEQAGNRPVIITTKAGAYVDLTAYEPGLEALKKGMLPSGGLIHSSAKIRAEYLAHKMDEIRRYAESNCPQNMAVGEFQRKLFAALYLSGAQFKGRQTKKRHEAELGINIPKQDLIINKPIEEALQTAHRELSKTDKPDRPSRKTAGRRLHRKKMYVRIRRKPYQKIIP